MFFLLFAAEEEQNQWLCGTLGVAVHSACGLQHPACTTPQTLKVLAFREQGDATVNEQCEDANDSPENLFFT